MLRTKTKLLNSVNTQFKKWFSISYAAKDCKLTVIDVDNESGIATLTMNKPPVNSCNLEMLQAMGDSIKQIQSDNCRGLIITSSNNKVFSSGLDLNELHKPNQERLEAFWRTLQEMWLALYLSSMPSAAAINGHALAVGCVISAACEYRVMLPGFNIGIHATKFGYVVPPFIIMSYLSVLPRNIVERALLQGKLFSTEEALKVNLIDEVAESKEEALSKCTKFIGSFASTNTKARALTKRQFRAADVQSLIDDPEKELRESLEYISSPRMQMNLDEYLKKLKTKTKK